MAAIFFDIDGTLWDKETVIPDSTVLAIQMLKENGHRTFLCSGRPRATIVGENLFALGMDGILAGCGTYIEYQGKIVFEHNLEPALLRRTVALLQHYGLPTLIEGNDLLFMDERITRDWYGAYLKKVLPEKILPLEGNEDRWCGCKFTVMTAGYEYDGAIRGLRADYEILQHGDKVMELVPKGYSKATGIQKACELFGISHGDTYAFGDSINDVDMLTYAAHGIAMGNGTAPAREAAEYITDDIHEDGLYNALRHYGLI